MRDPRLRDLRDSTLFGCSIHKTIRVPLVVAKMMDTPQFQRLRSIKVSVASSSSSSSSLARKRSFEGAPGLSGAEKTFSDIPF